MHVRALLGGIFPLSVSLLLSACNFDHPEGIAEPAEETTESSTNALVTGDLALTAPGHVSGTVYLPASLAVKTTLSGCDNKGGPNIEIAGDLIVENIPAKVLLSNNFKLTHTAEDTTSVDLILTNLEKRVFPKKYVTGNPVVYVQIEDHEGNPIGEPIFLGRCNGNGKVIDTKYDFVLPSAFDADFGPICDNTGPKITITGGVALAGFNAKLILGNKPLRKFQTTDADLLIALSPYENLTFAKQPSMGGVGGNPHIWLYLLGQEFYAGRCNGN